MDTWGLAVVAALVLGYAVVSRRLDRTVLTAPIVFVLGGLALGDDGLGLIDLRIGSEAVRLLAEVTLTLVLFADASRIELRTLRRELAFPARLLAIGLPLTILAGVGAAVGLFGELLLVEAVVLAIVLAPTDAALGQAVVTDPRLPSRIRQGLNVESGLNDGICVPLLFIALAVAEADVGAVTAHDALELVLEEIGFGVVGGLAAGIVGALALRTALRHELIGEEWLQVVPLAAAGLAYGIAAPLGGSGFIAAFVGGLAFGALRRGVPDEVTHVAEVTGLVLSALTFVVFGAAILGPALGVVGWESVVYAVLSLTVVRMLPVAVALLGTDARRADGRLQRLVRPAWACVDRLCGDRPRRGRAPPYRHDHRDDRADDRALGRRTRRHGTAADRRVRPLVRVAFEAAADGERAGARTALARASPTTAALAAHASRRSGHAGRPTTPGASHGHRPRPTCARTFTRVNPRHTLTATLARLGS